MKKLFVGNLSWKTTKEQLEAHFAPYGVVEAHVVIDPATNRSRGFGFVMMKDADAAALAIGELDGKPLIDRSLRISFAQERERSEREPRQYSGNRNGNRSHY